MDKGEKQLEASSYWYGKYSAAADFYTLIHKGMLEDRPFTLFESELLDKIRLHGEYSYNAYIESGGVDQHERPWTCPNFVKNMLMEHLSETNPPYSP